MIFCDDVDLLYWEPDVLKEAAFASQTLDSGTGNLAGTLFTVVTGTVFDIQRVEPGQVIVLSGAIAGCFAIVDMPDPFRLHISVLNDDYFPPSGSPPAAVAPGAASGLDFVIRTFWAQRRVVSDMLVQAIGLVPGAAETATAIILNPQALRRACVLGTLQMIYSAIAAAADEPA